MTRDETKNLLKVIVSTYPNWKPANMTDTIDAWTWALEDFPYESIQMAYKLYIRTDKSGFAPSVNQLITNLQKPSEYTEMSEGEAWAMVRKGIKNGIYGYLEEYEKLPDLVKKTVGDPKMLHEWAMMESESIDSVVASNFQRSYRTIVKRESEKQLIAPIMDRLSASTNIGIGVNK